MTPRKRIHLQQALLLVGLAVATGGCAVFHTNARPDDRAVERCRVSCAGRGMYLRGLFQRPVMKPKQVGCICVASRATRPPDKTPKRWYAPFGRVCPNFFTREKCELAFPEKGCQERHRGSALMKDCWPDALKRKPAATPPRTAPPAPPPTAPPAEKAPPASQPAAPAGP